MTASGGLEALDIFREHSQRGVISSAVLLDVDMRDLVGMQLAEISFASLGAAQIIMMLRSPLDSERANECKRLGIITVSKPLRRLSLWQALPSQTAIPRLLLALLESRIRLREACTSHLACRGHDRRKCFEAGMDG